MQTIRTTAVSSFVLFVVMLMIFGCSTPQSRSQNKRIEELERRISKIEFEGQDTSNEEIDVEGIMRAARAAK